MLKNIILKISIFQILFVISASAQQTSFKPTDLDVENLYGKVKRIDDEEAVLKINNGVQSEKDRRLVRKVFFDKKGRMTYEWTKIGNLLPFEKSYHYDKQGNRRQKALQIALSEAENNKPLINPLSLGIFRFNADTKTFFRKEYTIDRVLPEFLRQTYLYKFDDSGRIIEQSMFDANGGEVFKDVYIYGADKLPTEKHLSMAGNPVGQILKFKYTLDSQGNWTKRITENVILKNPGETKTEIVYRKISYYK